MSVKWFGVLEVACHPIYQSLLPYTNPSLTGIGEVVLLPLDVLKIKMQTNPDALKGRGIIKLLTEEGIAPLYRGWGWTMARNAPGSFAVGEETTASDISSSVAPPSPRSTSSTSRTTPRRPGRRVSRLPYLSPPLTPDFVASIAGAVASITVAAPLDVVKTRIQNANFGSNLSGMAIIREMVRNEGLGSFFKGLTPKVGVHCSSLMPDPRRRPQARLLVHARAESYPVGRNRPR